MNRKLIEKMLSDIIFDWIWKKARKQPVDKSVDNFGISVDKSAKPVDKSVDNFWAKKSYPQENRLIHILSTDLSTGKTLAGYWKKTTKKSYPQKMPYIIIIIFIYL